MYHFKKYNRNDDIWITKKANCSKTLLQALEILIVLLLKICLIQCWWENYKVKEESQNLERFYALFLEMSSNSSSILRKSQTIMHQGCDLCTKEQPQSETLLKERTIHYTKDGMKMDLHIKLK